MEYCQAIDKAITETITYVGDTNVDENVYITWAEDDAQEVTGQKGYVDNCPNGQYAGGNTDNPPDNGSDNEDDFAFTVDNPCGLANSEQVNTYNAAIANIFNPPSDFRTMAEAAIAKVEDTNPGPESTACVVATSFMAVGLTQCDAYNEAIKYLIANVYTDGADADRVQNAIDAENTAEGEIIELYSYYVDAQDCAPAVDFEQFAQDN